MKEHFRIQYLVFAIAILLIAAFMIPMATANLGVSNVTPTANSSFAFVGTNDAFSINNYMPVVYRQPTPTPVPNMIKNPSFEGYPYVHQYPGTGITTIQIPPSGEWRAWYMCSYPSGMDPNNPGDLWPCKPPCLPGTPGCYVPCSMACIGEYGQCSADVGCYWGLPEFVSILAANNPERVRSGEIAFKYFTHGRQHQAGVYQVVDGITPGRTLEFRIWMQAWMCDSCIDHAPGTGCDQPCKICHWNPTSENVTARDMHLKVGIDPYGGVDPTSPNVVWSNESGMYNGFDAYFEYRVRAVAQNSTVTVFTHSRPSFYCHSTHNDVYVDDAWMSYVD